MTSPFLRAETNSKQDTLILGGAFRYTYAKNSWDKTHENIGGKASFDVAILSAKGSVKGIEFAVENRYYAEVFGGFMLKNGYVAFPLRKNLKLKAGMPGTPFGILPYTSNSFMFNMQYYIGFEDDADIGAVLEYTQKKWEAQLSFAKNSEDIFSEGNKRYAYDLSGGNQEVNQYTGRVLRYFGEDKQYELGASGQYGGIYNQYTEETGEKYAFALHTYLKKNNWDLKAEVLSYAFSTQDTTDKDYIEMGAFAADYQVANEGVSYSIALGYTITINHHLLNSIKFYNDFSALEKTHNAFDASYMNVTGCMIHSGPVYTYVDYVLAKNQPWIGNNYTEGLSKGGDTKWNRCFNLNLGVYF